MSKLNDKKMITDLRCLALDMIHEAGSGHPGIALGAAPLLYTLFTYHINIDLNKSDWCNRDRFVLSCGHASSLYYALQFFLDESKYNLNDLLLQLRDKGIRTIEEVDYAILETNGKLSVFQKQDDNNNVFPLPLVLDGVIEENNLKFINKTRKWLNNELSKKKINLDNIFYAFYKDDDIYVIENEN